MGEPQLPDLSEFGLEVEALIGYGGSAVVYRARQEDVGGRAVAVKVVRPDLVADLRLLEREIKAVAKLRHYNTVTVHQAQTRRHPYFLVVELAEPDPPGPLAESRAVACGVKLCSALALAHRVGIVHSDIKPDNILWRGWEPLLGDFGTAVIKTQTRLRHDVGFTREWAAPWIPRRQADAFSDVWSLAAVVAWFVTGREPRGGGGTDLAAELAAALAPALVTDHPEDVAGTDPEHEADVAAFGPALALGRRLQRYQHRRGWPVTSFGEERPEADWTPGTWPGAPAPLLPPSSGHHPGAGATLPVQGPPGAPGASGARPPAPQPVPSPPEAAQSPPSADPGAPTQRAPIRHRRPPAWLLLVPALLIAGSIAFYGVMRGAGDRTGTDDPAAPGSSTASVTTAGGSTTTAAAGADGSAAPAPSTPGTTDVSSGPPQTGAGSNVGVLLFASDHSGTFDLLRRNGDGTVDVIIGTDDEDTSPSLSPDGAEVVFERQVEGVRAVFLAPVDASSPPRRLSPEGVEAGEPVWSPDGTRIAWASRANNNWDIAVHDLDAGTETLVVTGPSDDRNPSWAPDSSGLVFRSDRTGGGDVYALDLATQSLTQVTDTADRDDHPAWGENGLIAFERWLGGDAELYTVALTPGGGTDARRLTRREGYDGSPAFSGAVLLGVSRTASESQVVADPGGESAIIHRSAGRIQDVWGA